MKISRYKLNAILKSGLNPEIKTRKQLAVVLGVDSTSITRWFATRDRLGNPRFPVVPDRHVAAILQLFDLEAVSLQLNDEDFHRHCFELALQRAESVRKQSGLSQPSRAEKIAQRQLRIPPYRKRNVARLLAISFTVAVATAVSWQIIRWNDDRLVKQSPIFFAEENCWQGYSPELGEFSYWDESDPCHYRKLLNKALAELEANNSYRGTSTAERAVDDYIIFLSDQLDQRRIQDRAKLHFELGRRAFSQFDFIEAQAALKRASEQFSTLSNPDAILGEKIMQYSALATYADKPWRYARENYETQLLSDPMWKQYWSSITETQYRQHPARAVAISELENGKLQQAAVLIDEVISNDRLLLGEQHFYLASDYLVKSQILSLQNKLDEARHFAQEAQRLDSELLGERHPRIIQDQMVLVLIALKMENIAQAVEDYGLIADFLGNYDQAQQPVNLMDQQLQMGLRQLLAADKNNDQTARQAAWRELHQAFVSDNPYLPRRYAAVLLSDKLSSTAP